MTESEVFEAVTGSGSSDFAQVVSILNRRGSWCLIDGLAVNCYVEPVYMILGFDATRSIAEGARADNPRDPLDMLHVVFFMYVVLGFCGGAVVGLFAGGVVYVANRRPGAQLLNS